MLGLYALATRPSRRRWLHGGDRSQEIKEDVQHFADRIFTQRGARYRRVAMFPTSATTTRCPKAQLTIVAACLHVRSGSKAAVQYCPLPRPPCQRSHVRIVRGAPMKYAVLKR
jgi:hypothetical protein